MGSFFQLGHSELVHTSLSDSNSYFYMVEISRCWDCVPGAYYHFRILLTIEPDVSPTEGDSI